MQQLTAISLGEGRLVAVLFHKDDISLSYRVLSNDDRFKEGLDFFRMKDPTPDVMKQFELKKLPSLLVMVVDKSNDTQPEEVNEQEGRKGMNLQVAHYTGKFNYDDLEKYLNVFVQKPKTKEEVETRDLKEIKSRKHFEGQCAAEGCYLLLIDGSEDKKDSNAAYINTLKKNAAKTYHNFGYLDGKCHSEFIGKLEIYAEDLPALIYLNAKF